MISIGLVAAMPEESEHIYGALGKFISERDDHGFKVRIYSNGNKKIHIIGTGIGEIQAALATQYLIENYHVQYIVNFGIVGNFSPNLDCLDTVFVDRLVHYDYSLNAQDITSFGKYDFQRDNAWLETDRSLLDLAHNLYPNIPKVKLASGDKFVNTNDLREWLIKQFDANICDMESAGIYLACKRYNVPCLFIKTISDNADGNANVSFSKIIDGGVKAYVEIVCKILENI